MPDPFLDSEPVSSEIHQRIGAVSAEWSWVEILLGEMLSFFVKADPGAMYVITNDVNGKTLVSWLRTLSDIKAKDADTLKVFKDLLNEVDDLRATRNTIVHGAWQGHGDPSVASVNTFRWSRSDVSRTEVWSVHDLDEFIGDITAAQRRLGALGVHLGFLRHKKPIP